MDAARFLAYSVADAATLIWFTVARWNDIAVTLARVVDHECGWERLSSATDVARRWDMDRW